jgi:hypothetical protein
MKNKFGFIVVLLMIILGGCLSTPKLTESSQRFTDATQVNIAVPMRFFTWVKTTHSKNLMPDMFKDIFDYDYVENGDYLVKSVKNGDILFSVWGKQVMQQNVELRTFFVTPFILSVYALQDGNDPLDEAFDAFNQMLAKGQGYEQYEKSMIPIIKDGLKAYRSGGDDWKNYKINNFSIEEKTIRFK